MVFLFDFSFIVLRFSLVFLILPVAIDEWKYLIKKE